MSCSPPRGMAANYVVQRAAKATTHSPPNSADFGLRAPGVGEGPARKSSDPKGSQMFSLQSSPKPSLMLGPAQRENRLRFSRPKNRHSPILRPVSASLRLRCRSAAFSHRPLGFHLDFANAKRVKSLFRRAGDGVLRTTLCSRAWAMQLLRRGAIELCPAWYCSFCEQKEPKKL